MCPVCLHLGICSDTDRVRVSVCIRALAPFCSAKSAIKQAAIALCITVYEEATVRRSLTRKPEIIVYVLVWGCVCISEVCICESWDQDANKCVFVLICVFPQVFVFLTTNITKMLISLLLQVKHTCCPRCVGTFGVTVRREQLHTHMCTP